MTKRIHINVLLAVCTALVGFGILTIAISPGFFMNLLGAGMMGPGAPLPISSGPIDSNLNDPKRPGGSLRPGRGGPISRYPVISSIAVQDVHQLAAVAPGVIFGLRRSAV
jgi:hypothetical protein